MKKTALCAVLAAVAVIAFSGCKADEPPPSGEIAEASGTVSLTEASKTESTSETETEIFEEEEETPENVSPYKGPDDFYITVTDCEGGEKILFYMLGDEENDTMAYMEAAVDDPERLFGYMSVISNDLPAKVDKAFFGEDLRRFAEQAHSGYAAISYFYADNGFASESQTMDINDDPQKFEKLIDLISEFVPEYVPELASEQDDDGHYTSVNTLTNVYDETVNGNYDMRYPITSLNIYPRSDHHYRNVFSVTQVSRYSVPSINFSFSRYGDRTIGRMRVCDYREIQKLTLSEKQPPSPEELEKAYYASTYYVSDWFYADDAEFYDYALKYVLLSDENKFPNVKQDRTYKGYDPRSGFSENIAACLNTSGKIPAGYEAVQFGDVYFILPDDGKTVMNSDRMFIWKNSDDGSILLQISENNSIYGGEVEILRERGTFNNQYCMYISSYSEKHQTYSDGISFKDAGGTEWKASFKLDSAERTEEYDTLVKNVFGSISAYDPTEEKEDVKIKLASEPSIYASDGMELAEGYSYRGNSYIAYYPDMMIVTFYALDWNNDYDTGFECYLEKQEEDGLWYRVEPLGGDIVQVNSGSGHFYNVFEEGRKHVTFDLAAYPLLPPGNYRLAKTFWEAGSNDRSQYAAFFEFRMSDASANYGSGITGSAKCGQETYSSGVREITYSVNIDAESFIESNITDIERLENGKWISVRTKPVRTNSIGGSYALRFSGMEETIDTGDFDISKAGEYRIRISVGKYDILTDDDMFVNDYDTIYAYFSIAG